MLINYSIGTKRHEKLPDIEDIRLIEKIEATPVSAWTLTNRMDGWEKHVATILQVTHVHHFTLRRNLITLMSFLSKIEQGRESSKAVFLYGSLRILSKAGKTQQRAQNGKLWSWMVNAGVTGTFYISSCPLLSKMSYSSSKKEYQNIRPSF